MRSDATLSQNASDCLGLMPARRIAVTGASGFVGKRLLHRLLRDGFAALALSRHRSGIPGVSEVLIQNYDDVGKIAAVLARVDVVVHLAARAHQLDDDVRDVSQSYLSANVGTTVAVAKASCLAGVKRFVFVSSIGVNGNRTCGKPFSLADVAKPIEHYAKSKWLAEQALATELGSGETDFTILRPPLIYGPGCPGNFNRLIQWVAKPLIVPLGALNAPRTFIYVENLIDALTVAAWHPGASRRTFLVTDDVDTSVSEIVRIFAAYLGRKPAAVWNIPPGVLSLLATVVGQRKTFEKLAHALQVDGTEFCDVTGWHPPFSTQEGLRLTVQVAAEKNLRSAARM